MKVTIIMGEKAEDTQNYIACAAILTDCKINFDPIIDTVDMMKISLGRCHPDYGLVILFPDERTMATNYFGLVQWIENNGLRPI